MYLSDGSRKIKIIITVFVTNYFNHVRFIIIDIIYKSM